MIWNYARIAENGSEVAESWAEFDNITKYKMLGKGTHAQIAVVLYPWELNWGTQYNHGRGWYRSKEVIPGFSPYAGIVTNIKWMLNEEIISYFSDLFRQVYTK